MAVYERRAIFNLILCQKNTHNRPKDVIGRLQEVKRKRKNKWLKKSGRQQEVLGGIIGQ